MSTTIDSKVVEMRFDNKHFESNVSTTMSTLDKLKQKLHLDGATKGLDNVSSAAKKVDLSAVGKAADTIQTKFSAMEVIGVTALANLTNSAVNAGKRIVSALTIDPVKSGFSEYEMKMDSIKTIVNSTGRDLADVNKLLEELNEYSDQTIYSFKDMTQNIGKFTNAGVGLEDAVLAIKGISNEAAVSGASAAEASRAMYNFSQALSAGYVKLIDWKSIENANMATKEFKQQLIDTAVELGVVSQEGDMYVTSTGKSFNATKNFNDVLQEQWMTTDVLIKTLGKYADSNTDIGKKAFAAAQEVTKLTQMWDVLKETAQSGWARTWELIVGDLESAKKIWTPLTNFFSGLINGMSDARNRVLEIALHFTKPWDAIVEKLGGVKKVADTVGKVTDQLEYFQDVVNRVWRGDFNNQGDNPDRRDLLRAAGYDPRVVQDLVNKGYKYKLTVEDIEASHKKFGLTMETTQEETEKVTVSLDKLTDEQLKNAGLTEEEIRLYRALEKEADRLGISVSDLADEMSKNNGRDMLIDSFKNVGDAILGIGKAIKQAWVDIFNPPSVEEVGVRLYGMIRSLRDFTESLRLTDKETGELNESGKKFLRTFKGVFALVDIVATIVGGPLKIAFKAITQLLGYFNLDILGVTASVGDAIVGFRDWLDGVLDFTKVYEKIIPPIQKGIAAFRKWINTLKESKNLPKDIAKGIVNGLGKAVDFVINIFKNFKAYLSGGFEGVSDNVISGLVKGLWNGIKVAGQVIVELGRMLIDKICDVLGIHSPSTVFIAIGGFVIAGLMAGLTDGSSGILGTIADIGKKIIDAFKAILDDLISGDIDFGQLLSFGLSAGLLVFLLRLSSALGALAKPLEGFGDILDSTSKVIDKFGGVLTAAKWNLYAESLKSVAIAIAILAASIIALSFIDAGKLWNAVGVIAVLAAVIAGFSIAMSKFGGGGSLKDTASVAITMIGISTTLMILAGALSIMNKLNVEKCLGILTGLVIVIAALGTVAKAADGKEVGQFGTAVFKIAAAMLVMVLLIKIIGSMNPETAIKGFVGLTALILEMGLLMLAMKLLNRDGKKTIDGAGKALLTLAGTMIILAIVIKMLGEMKPETAVKGFAGLTALIVEITLLMLAMKLLNRNGDKSLAGSGGTIFGIAAALLALALVVKVMSGIRWQDALKGGVGLLALVGVIVGLMFAMNKLGDPSKLERLGTTLLMISVAIGILAGITVLLGFIKPMHMAKGLAVVSVLSLMMAGMIKACRGANKVTGNVVAISIAIVTMVAAVAALSLIEPAKLAMSTSIMVVLLAMLTLLTKTAGQTQGSLGTLIVMTVAIGLIAGIVYLLAQNDVDSALKSAAAMSVLMLAMSAVVKVISKMSTSLKQAVKNVALLTSLAIPLYVFAEVLSNMDDINDAEKKIASLSVLMLAMSGVTAILSKTSGTIWSALTGVAALTALAIPLLAFVGVLALMNNVDNAITNAIALSILAGALTLMLSPLCTVGNMIAMSGGAALFGVAGLLLMAVPLLALVGILYLMQGIQNATKNALLLGGLMVALTAVLAVLALIGPAALVGVGAMAALVGLIVAVGALAVGIGALMTKFPQIQEFLDKGIPVLNQLAFALGSFVGNLIKGFADAVLDIIPLIGTKLSEFMTNVDGFIQGCKTIDESVIAGAGILAGAILAITAADLIAGISSFLQGGDSFATLGTDLSTFMTNASGFIEGVSSFTPETVEAVRNLAEAIIIITAANLLNGITAFLGMGDSGLATFGTQLGFLGEGITSFATSVQNLPDNALEKVKIASQAIKEMATAAESIPATGGWLQKLVGEKDLATFIGNLPMVGSNLLLFANNLSDFEQAHVDRIKLGATAIKEMVTVANTIPSTGGWLQKLVGEKDLATFVGNLPMVGSNLALFAKNLSDFEQAHVDKIKLGATAIKEMSAVAQTIPATGWLQKLVGEKDLATFAGNLPMVGYNLQAFVTNLGTFRKSQLETVTMGAAGIKALASTANSIEGDNWWEKLTGTGKADDMKTFGECLSVLGGALKGFVSSIGKTSLSSLSATVTQVDKLVDLAKGIVGTDFGNFGSFGENLGKVATAGVDKFVEKFKNGSAKALAAGKGFVTSAANGISNNAGLIHLAIDDALAGSLLLLDDYVTLFSGAGKAIVQGLADGISNSSWIAEDAAAAAARDAYEAAREELDVNSPSKVFRELGKSIPEGMAMGIDRLSGMVTESSVSMAKKATSSVTETVSRIADMVSTDIDAQPTIRPVLDLSNVRSGAGAIGNMLGFGTSVGVMSNINAIGSAMNNGQNGANDDVVSAINKLRSDMSSMDRAQYNINGISVNEGTDAAEAINVLVRAITMDGRS